MKKISNQNNPEKQIENVPTRLFISLRVDFTLMSEINAYVDSLKAKGDFRYKNTSEFIRQSLLAYRAGMELSFLSNSSPKRYLSLLVDQEIFNFYQTLPEGNKASIVERCLRTYLHQQSIS